MQKKKLLLQKFQGPLFSWKLQVKPIEKHVNSIFTGEFMVIIFKAPLTKIKTNFSDHPPNHGDLPRNDSCISLEDNVDERYIRIADKDDSLEDVFVVDLEKCQAEGLGLGLIDGMVS